MTAIILGKNLITTEELIEYAFSEQNTECLNLNELMTSACDAAFQSSLLLIRMMNAEKIYIESSACNSKPTLGPNTAR